MEQAQECKESADNLAAGERPDCHREEWCSIQSKETGEKFEVLTMVGDERRTVKIGTWNVRSLNGVGRLEEVKREMKRYKMSSLGVSEVRWKGQKDFVSDNGMRIIYSGGE